MKYLSLLAIFVFLGIGCSADIQEEPAELVTPIHEVPPTATEPVKDVMAPSQGMAPPQVNQMDITGGIYDHAVFFASSFDGEEWDIGETAIAMHASVPELLVLDQAVGNLPAGTAMSYFVDSSPLADGLDEAVSFVTSTDDGETWSERTQIELDEEYLPVDPSVIQLADGRLRLHFFDFTSSREVDSNKDHIFYSAISDDGINFEIEGESLVSETLMTDPEVVFFDDEWFMYFAMHEGDNMGVWVATSDDGITFGDPVKIDGISGIPGATVVDGVVQLYGCDGGIVMTTSENGIDFEELPESTVSDQIGPNGKPFLEGPSIFKSDKFFCDPSPAVFSDGSIGLVMKTIVEN
jgi:hypothetical protein